MLISKYVQMCSSVVKVLLKRSYKRRKFDPLFVKCVTCNPTYLRFEWHPARIPLPCRGCAPPKTGPIGFWFEVGDGCALAWTDAEGYRRLAHISRRLHTCGINPWVKYFVFQLHPKRIVESTYVKHVLSNSNSEDKCAARCSILKGFPQ